MLVLLISPFVRQPMYDPEMGYSRRKESREIAEVTEESNRSIEGVTLGQLSAAGMVTLHVSCHQWPPSDYRPNRQVQSDYGAFQIEGSACGQLPEPWERILFPPLWGLFH